MKKAQKNTSALFDQALGFELLHRLPNGIMVADQHTTTFVFTNERMQNWLGYTAEELLGKTPAFIHPSDEMDRVMLSFQAMLKGDMQEVKHIRFITKSKEIKYFDIHAQLFESAQGTFICGFFSPSDDDGRVGRESDEELLLRQRLEAAQEVGNMGFWTLFHANNLLEWSDNAFRIFGVIPRSFQPTLETFLDKVYHADRDKVAEAFSNHLSERLPYDIIHRVETNSGDIKFLRERCVTSYDEQDQPIYSFGTVLDVTTLEKARLEALNHFEKLQSILEKSRSFTWEIDAKGNLLHLSDSAEKLFGVPVHELLGKSVFDYLHEAHDDGELMAEQLSKAEEQLVVDKYVPLKTQNGSLLWLSVSAIISRDDKGICKGFVGSATDITQRKSAEDLLIASEIKFRGIADALPGAVWISDLNFNMQYVSPGITRLAGFSQEEFLSQKREDRYSKASLKKILGFIEQQKFKASSGKWTKSDDLTIEVQMLCADGSTKWVQISTTLLMNTNGEPKGFLGVVTDISELVGREQLLERLNNLLESGGRLAQMGTWELDLASGQLIWGKVTFEIHEVAFDFVPQLDNALDFYLPEDKELLQQNVARVQKEGGIYDLELRLQTAKGNQRWVRTMGHADFDDKTCVRLWGVIIDIDDYKEKSLALEVERARLQNVLAATNVATWYWNVQTGETIFDELWAEMVGYRLADLMPVSIKTWESFCHPDDLRIAEQKLEAYFSGKSDIYETEFRLKHKGGHWVWVRDVGSVVEWTADGKPLAMYGTHEDITPTVELRDRLKEQDDRLRMITDNLNEVFWLRDAHNESFLYVSPSAAQMFGISAEDLKRSPEKWLSGIHPDDFARVDEVFKNLRKGSALDILYRFKRPNGSIAWIQSSTKPVFDGQNQLKGYAGFASDVTQRESLLHALEAAEQKYRIIAENNSNWEFWQLPTGQFAYHSPSSEAITGYNAAELMDFSDKLSEIIHPDDLAAYREHHNEAGCNRSSGRIQFRIIDKAGSIHHIEHFCQSIFDAKGTYLGIRGTNIDITDKKEAEQQLRKLWKALEQSNASIVITNLKGEIEYVNPYFTQLTGYSYEEAMGQNPRILQSGHTTPEEYKGMWAEITNGKTWQGEFQNKKKDGSLYWESATISPVRDEHGKIVSYLAIKENITHRKESAERLRQSEAKYRLLAEHINDVIWIYNFQHSGFTYISPSVEQLRGYTVEEAMAEKLEDTLSESDLWSLQARFEPLLQSLSEGKVAIPDPIIVEVKQPCKDGSLVWTEISIKFHINELNEFEALGVSRNINERKAAELTREEIREKLRESEARFKTLFYENASAMYLIDAEKGCFIDANEAALAFYGYERDAFIGKSLSEINGEADYLKKKLQFLKEHRQGRFEFKHKRSDNSWIDVELFSSLLELNGEEVIHEIIHDISDKNIYLSEIQRQNALLKEIAWTQSHVVRAPLARIMSLVDLIEVEGSSIYSEKLILDSLVQSAKELDEMVRQITLRTQELGKI